MYNSKTLHLILTPPAFSANLFSMWKVKCEDYVFNTDIKNTALFPPALLSLVRSKKGHGEIILKNKTINMGPDTLLLINHADRMGWKSKRGVWEYVWYNFTSSEKVPFLQLNNLYSVIPDFNETEKENKLFELSEIQTEVNCGYINALFNELVYSFITQLQLKQKTCRPYNKEIQQVISYISENLSQNIDFKQIAHDICISERYLRMLFSEETGMPPKRFHKYLRIKKAAELLNQHNFNISQVADTLGYSSPFHLTRDFKEFFGLSPSAYKKHFDVPVDIDE